MAIMNKPQAAIPAGPHTGQIVSATETSKDFGKGPEQVVEVVIMPAWRQDAETETLPVAVTFSPVVNGISALSKFLNRLALHPKTGAAFEPTTLVGVKVNFTAGRTERDFVRVNKDSISRAK